MYKKIRIMLILAVVCFGKMVFSAAAGQELSPEDQALLAKLEAEVAPEDAVEDAEYVLVEVAGVEKDLLQAAKNNDTQAVKVLLKDVPDSFSFTAWGTWVPAITSQFASDPSININAKNPENGYTALHYAAKNNNKELYDFLKKKGADDSIVAQDGITTPESLKLASETEATAKAFATGGQMSEGEEAALQAELEAFGS